MRDDGDSGAQRGGGSDGSPTAGEALDPRQRILAATRALIAEQGWNRVTTRKVAERANVNNALVHYYFGTKRALLLQAATDVLVNEFGGPLEALAGDAGLEGGVADALAWLERVGPSDTSSRVVVEMMLQAVHDPALQETSRAMLGAFRRAVRERAEAQGFAPERAAGVATVLAALLDGLYLHILLDPELDLQAATRALRPLFLQEDR